MWGGVLIFILGTFFGAMMGILIISLLCMSAARKHQKPESHDAVKMPGL